MLDFNKKFVLAAIHGNLAAAEVVKDFVVNISQPAVLKELFPSGESGAVGNDVERGEESAGTTDQMHTKIGELTMRNVF